MRPRQGSIPIPPLMEEMLYVLHEKDEEDGKFKPVRPCNDRLEKVLKCLINCILWIITLLMMFNWVHGLNLPMIPDGTLPVLFGIFVYAAFYASFHEFLTSAGVSLQFYAFSVGLCFLIAILVIIALQKLEKTTMK